MGEQAARKQFGTFGYKVCDSNVQQEIAKPIVMYFEKREFFQYLGTDRGE